MVIVTVKSFSVQVQALTPIYPKRWCLLFLDSSIPFTNAYLHWDSLFLSKGDHTIYVEKQLSNIQKVLESFKK